MWTVQVALSRAAAALAAVCLLAGCGSNPASPSKTPGPPAAGAAVSYTAVGASDAMGIGASVLCIPYSACPTGTGYVPDIVRQLQADGSNVTLMNLGIPSAVIGPDFQALTRAHPPETSWTFLADEMPFVPRDATVVTIFAGGNDANVVGRAVADGAAGSDVAGYVDAQIRAFASDYTALIRGIKARAPNARIVVANLPNFAGVPQYSADQRALMQKITVGFTTQAINPLAGSESIAVADLMCDARSYDPGIYSSDGFHPNDTGYAYIASVLMQAIRSTSYAAPRSSCAQMTLVPPL